MVVVLPIQSKFRTIKIVIFNYCFSILHANTASPHMDGKVVKYLKRIGLAGFLFFLLKGLVWIGVFYFAGKSCR